MEVKKYQVTIIYKTLPQYRRKFFELLKERLDQHGVELNLIYGQPGIKDAAKKDTVDLPWAHKITNHIIRVGNRELYWQPCIKLLKKSDLVIVEQASKLLVNYYLFAAHLAGRRKMAFWGHGKNFQGHTASSLGENVKRFLSRRVHWWFSYNQTSADVVREIGFPEEKITIVQNAIDTKQLTDISAALGPSELDQLKLELGINSNQICIYAGGMYEEKRLPFLLEACKLIRKQVPDFHMIFIGAGSEDNLVKEAAAKDDWIHYVGPKFDAAKVPYFEISKLFLMPGLVGLAILDTFALGVPIVTTEVPYHSPEIEYLVNDYNGVICKDAEDIVQYADTVIKLLQNDVKHAKLVKACLETGSVYTVEEMADRFAQGVLLAMGVEGARVEVC
ncbi:hypothetical protein Back11_31820 [Paenibacillus baekrokdamisoli]|uniref:Uncharacterized protein n=1 Tax=Paenibacillus baekrokdamisoli TaxID=1712516 RepID=A0A3G9ISN3_9BACL|nr:glycosyltransferase family 4 protein [Paenibacillus baekrokdamisoli]MBB3071653.1 glycosyltransferase involved in cell wall biosynthesis [Paenibacillus baekrokdamisoli]BBH21837.1 hypothetical protein Back11_31820 [Paenibacillus baekrokdamisoli]